MTDWIARHVADAARARMEYAPALVIEGARQVGKSTLAQHLAAPDARLVSLDDEETRAAASADAAGFVAQAGAGQLVIDEIQRAPALTLALKAAIDSDRRPGRFILTGSASLLRVRGTADSLAGRIGRVHMHGLSRGEISGVVDDLAGRVRADGIDQLVDARGMHTRAGYAGLLTQGAYPEAIRLNAPARSTWIDDYLDGVLFRDLPELRKEVQPRRALAVLRTLAGRQSAELVQARLASEVGIPPRTLPGYLDLLQDVGLVTTIPPWTPNLAKRETGRSKTVVLDGGIATRLARVTVDQLSMLEYGEGFGAFLEAWVVAEIMKQRTWSSESFELFHYRDRAGAEVDLVLEFDDGQVLAIEVKASSSYNGQQFANLVKLRDRLGDRFLGGIVLGSSDHGYRYADRLVGAPISVLWDPPA